MILAPFPNIQKMFLFYILQIPQAKYKIKYRNYDLKSLELAYKRVKEDLSVNRAAINFRVPVTTLRDRVAGRISFSTTSSGPESLLSRQE